MGNDDQCSWGMAAMNAAESQFPSRQGLPAWHVLAQNVFENMAARFWREVESQTCGGGLRWQIPVSNVGYEYKNGMCRFFLLFNWIHYSN